MTEQKLKGELKKVLKQIPRDINRFLTCPNLAPSYDNYIDQIHTLYKEAGYKSPEEVAEFILSVNEAAALAKIDKGRLSESNKDKCL